MIICKRIALYISNGSSFSVCKSCIQFRLDYGIALKDVARRKYWLIWKGGPRDMTGIMGR